MHIHLIGVAGTAMAALAKLLVDLGHRVTGSDQDVYPPMSTELERLGIAVLTPYAARNLEPAPDRVVIGNAIPRGNPEVEACLDRGLNYTSQAEAIEDLVLPGRDPVVIAGTHGKTTTTALVAWVLTVAGRDPGWFIGGVPLDLPSTSALGRGRELVIEGDEYDTAYFDKRPKFHHYRPRLLVINNLEYDHADIYPDLESIAREFRRLVNTVPGNGLVAVGADCEAAVAVVTASRASVVRFGLGPGADLTARDVRAEPGGTRFTAVASGSELGEVFLALHGRANLLNTLAAIAVTRHLGVPFPLLAKALAGFHGVKRRLELRGVVRDVAVYDDFAHHPTAIRETIAALRGAGLRGRVWAVLEPRSWSMRRNVHQEALPAALAEADVVAMAPVFEIEKVPAGLALDVPRVLRQVSELGREAHAVAGSAELAALIASRARPGDAVLIMSNGGFDRAHERTLAALAAGS